MRRYPKPDLTDCDREPIHLIGAIQPFGALLAFAEDWTVSHASANAGEILGRAEPVELGTPAAELLSEAMCAQMRKASSVLGGDDMVQRDFDLDLAGDGSRYDCAMHAAEGPFILEFEPHRDSSAGRLTTLRPILSRFEAQNDLSGMMDEAVRQLQTMLGYDRVMLYHFHPDGSGEVIAEARSGDTDSFLGLRYPVTDIPQQARELFLRNRFRVIADMGAQPVPVMPQQAIDGSALDLSMSVLRASSEVHVEYMHNMGVSASLTIAVVVGGKLWGMFACHHSRPHLPGFGDRTLSELFSELFSLSVERMLARQDEAQRKIGDELHQKLLRSLTEGETLGENLITLRETVQRALPHDGLSVFADGEYRALGEAPSGEEFKALLPAFNTGAVGKVFATEELSATVDAAESFADRASGALVLPISRRPRDYFVLWRRPLRQVVTWGGNPEKVFSEDGKSLTPRASFEAWQETVTTRSAFWTPAELRLADSLRTSLLEVILKLSDEAASERKRAQEKQELLIAELNHRVRNILNLIRGLVNQSSAEADDTRSLVEIIGGRINALASAHDNITRENWSAASIKALIRNEAEAYLGEKRSRLTVTGDDVFVAPEAYTVLALVIHEMTTNSAKYGSLSDSSGSLDLALSKTDSGDLAIHWIEQDGPPVKEPTRRGFGTQIITQSIPHELGGQAEIEYKPGGVEAQFVVPARFLSEEGVAFVEGDDTADETSGDDRQAHKTTVPKHVLLVEDSMIIALDSEAILGDLGVAKVTVASSVKQAMEALEGSAPDMAILDFNLGEETSAPVAEALKGLGVPFVLATGYGELSEQFVELGARGVLQKPYGVREIEHALALCAPDQQ